jgi:hypothetical protein
VSSRRRPRARRPLVAGLAAIFLLGPAAAAEAVNIVTANQSVPSTGGQAQAGRLDPDGVPSGCEGVLKFEPELATGQPGPFHYINHTFRSSLTHPICLTVDIQTACTTTPNRIFSVGYVGAFDPANPLTNYAADSGSSPPGSYSFAPGAGASFAIVVHEVTANAGCSAYTLTVSSDGPWADAPPSIGGTPAAGTALTGNDADWEATPAVQRRWRRCDSAGGNCTDIPGATGATYTVADEDLGHTLRFRNDATDADGTSTSDSRFIEPFIPFETRAAESLGPGDRVQDGIFVRNGVESRCGVPATPPPILQLGNSFLYDVFPVASLLNEPVCLVARTAPMCGNGVTPAIYSPAFAPTSGLANNYGGNSGNGYNLVGAVSSTLPAAEGREVTVSQGNTAGTCPAYGVTLGADAPFATARPAVGGSPVEGSALTASDGTWSGSPTFGRSWRRCEPDGAACTPIEGATAASYTLTAADVGRRLRVRVTATQGRSVSSDSEPSGVVAADPTADPPLDRTAPTATLRLASRNLARAVKTGRLPVRVTCNEPCSAAVRVRVTSKLGKRLKLRGKVVIARAQGNVAAGSRKTLRTRLTRRARRALKRRKSLEVRVAATFTDAAGNGARKSLKRSLKRPRRR